MGSNDIHSLTMADVEAATHIMAQAFKSDPLWCYMLPDEVQRIRTLYHLFRFVLTLAIQREQAYGGGEPLQGVAIWKFPDQKPLRFSLALVKPTVRLLFSSFTLSVFKVGNILLRFEEMQKHYVPEPHYYLQMIGIAPESQGKGLASKLIRPFLNQADARGISAYTDTMTPNNVGLYQHYGYQVVEVAQTNQGLNIWAFCHSSGEPKKG